jgi:trimethylamine--corrinoid protein Co-methyltransferase
MMSETRELRRQPIEPWRPAHVPQLHDDAYLDRLIDAALQVLACTGVKVLSDKAVAVFREHGAEYDAESHVVRLPEELVRGALESAPRSFILRSRDGSCDLDLGSGATYMTADGCGTEVIDWRTGERRHSTKADLADATRMLDYVSSIAYWWPIVGAGDCGESAQLHELDAAWNNTVKHVQPMIQGESQARLAIEMATVIAGSAEELRRRPPISDLTFTVSPLTIDRDGGDAALVFAAAGVPMVLGAGVARGTTGPATAAGAMAQSLAEVLSLVTLVQLASPGAPAIAYPSVLSADPRTGELFGSMDARDPALGVALSHRVGLPSQQATGGTTGELPGTWMAASEAGPSLTMSAWSGSELAVGLGLTNSDMLWTPEALILDDDLYHGARYTVMDTPVDDEELALDVIDTVGPGGHYLGHAHTRKHMRAGFVRGLASEPDAQGGYRDAVEVARERALEILEHYVPEPLEPDKVAELARIVAAADRELRS